MIINFGSINIDHVYQVDHFVLPGETQTCRQYSTLAGGKGLNQSIALSRTGAKTIHMGAIGHDGLFLKDYLEKENIDTSHLKIDVTPTGHAMIQVNRAGENCIIVYGGANQTLTPKDIEHAIQNIPHSPFVLLQNEINAVEDILLQAAQVGKKIFLNPSPFTPDLLKLPLHKLHTLILNEIECQEIGQSQDTQEALRNIHRKAPTTEIVLTRGKNSIVYYTAQQIFEFPVEKIANVVDTTAAGDTFTGYYLGNLAQGITPADAIKRGIKASALCIQKKGAAQSIPYQKEITDY